MAIDKTTVTGPILDANGVAYANAVLLFTPSAVGGDDATDTVIANTPVETVVTSGTGDFSVDLAPSDTITYVVDLVVSYPDVKKAYRIGLIKVPDSPPVSLQDLLPIYDPSLPTNEELLAALSSAVALAGASADEAAAAAALAVNSSVPFPDKAAAEAENPLAPGFDTIRVYEDPDLVSYARKVGATDLIGADGSTWEQSSVSSITLDDYLKLTGGTLTGPLAVTGGAGSGVALSHNGTAGFFDTTGNLNFRWSSLTKFAMDPDGEAPFSASVLNRGAADARYAPIGFSSDLVYPSKATAEAENPLAPGLDYIRVDEGSDVITYARTVGGTDLNTADLSEWIKLGINQADLAAVIVAAKVDGLDRTEDQNLWTPYARFSNDDGAFTYTTQSGEKDELFSRLWVEIDLTFTIATMGTGNLQVTGLGTATNTSSHRGYIDIIKMVPSPPTAVDKHTMYIDIAPGQTGGTVAYSNDGKEYALKATDLTVGETYRIVASGRVKIASS